MHLTPLSSIFPEGDDEEDNKNDDGGGDDWWSLTLTDRVSSLVPTAVAVISSLIPQQSYWVVSNIIPSLQLRKQKQAQR